jgi:hypothetical protein
LAVLGLREYELRVTCEIAKSNIKRKKPVGTTIHRAFCIGKTNHTSRQWMKICGLFLFGGENDNAEFQIGWM